jgi:hypothetical protein
MWMRRKVVGSTVLTAACRKAGEVVVVILKN